MALFPMFVNLKQKEVLIIGGGKVATRKVKTLLNFGPSITVIARQTTMGTLERREETVCKASDYLYILYPYSRSGECGVFC